MSRIPKQSSSSQASRSLRSNTDKSHQPLSEVLRKAAEETAKAKSKSQAKVKSKSLSDLDEGVISQISSPHISGEKEKAQAAAPDSSHKQRSTTLLFDYNFGYFEDDYFVEKLIPNPVKHTVHRPRIPMEDLKDDVDQLEDSVKDIQAVLDAHAPAAPAVPAPLNLKQVELRVNALQSLFSKFEDLKSRTRRVYRTDGKTPAEIKIALDAIKVIEKSWEKAKINADEIRETLEASSVSRVKVPKADFDGQNKN